MNIRPEQKNDLEQIHAIHAAAFETEAEACLVDALREQADPVISLVAAQEGVVGHILFSPVTVEGVGDVKLAGLAPMAVCPDGQRQGVGTALVQEGLKACAAQGVGAVVVLGHPNFYPRFGFEPASRFGLSCTYDVPDEVFMALELEPGSLDGLSGTVRYHSAFDALE